MQNSARKTFHFEPKPKEVLRHLSDCPTCLSRVTGSLWGIVGLDALRLLQGVQQCMHPLVPIYRKRGLR